MSTSTEEDIIGGPAGRPAAAPDEDVLGRADTGEPAGPTPPPPPEAAAPVADTEDGRLAESTRFGPLKVCPFAYADDTDWQTIGADNPFRVLYLDYRQWASISDEQVQTNGRVLAEFWDSRLKLLIRGGDRLKARFGENTIEQAPKRLERAMRALADTGRRQAYFNQLDDKRRAAATAALEADLARALVMTENVMNPRAIKTVLEVGTTAGFTLPEAQTHLQAAMDQARLKPVVGAPPVAHPLLATWTINGEKPVGQAHIKVLRQDVYDLDQAGQVLYTALVAGDERATEALDNVGYLVNIAHEFKENDVELALQKVFSDKRYNLPNQRPLRRLKALYLLGPALPLHLPGVAEFSSPAQLLSRAATSAPDFVAAEAAFTSGVLPIWVQAAATADVQAALPAASNTKGLDFRRFLHKAAPTFPLWIGGAAFASPTQLATYIRRDENTWKMVYGSLNAGNLIPWLGALGQSNILERQEQLATAFAGQEGGALVTDRELSVTDIRNMLAVQALLEALDPATAVPSLAANLTEVDLTGLSGETQAERILTFTNTSGGAVRVFLEITPQLEGVSLSSGGLFFYQRAPGQQLSITLTGNPSLMPRDGQHTAMLQVRTAYTAAEVAVRAEAVFPQKQFLQFVVGAGLALAAVFGGVRLLLGQLLSESSYADQVAQGTLLPLTQAVQNGRDLGFTLVGVLLLFIGLVYGFVRVLARLAKPQPAA